MHKLFSLDIRSDRHINRVSIHMQLVLVQPSYQSLSCLHVDWSCSCRGSAEHSTAFELHGEPCTRLLQENHRQILITEKCELQHSPFQHRYQICQDLIEQCSQRGPLQRSSAGSVGLAGNTDRIPVR